MQPPRWHMVMRNRMAFAYDELNMYFGTLYEMRRPWTGRYMALTSLSSTVHAAISARETAADIKTALGNVRRRRDEDNVDHDAATKRLLIELNRAVSVAHNIRRAAK